MSTLKPYPAYADTDLAWLPKIPRHWEISKVKRGYEIRLGKMLRPEPITPSDTLEPYLRAANVQWQDVNTDDVKEMWFSQWEKPLYELREGDLMVCEGGDVGRAAIWQGQLEKCYIQNSIHRVRSRTGFINKFLYYWLIVLKNGGYIDLLCNKATIAHFTAEKFAEVELVVPPLPEQRTIAAYLDRQTAKIDALIAKKQRLLDLLAEQRAALISQAVTKGLNPNVKMKDSGVAWLGQVPSHWEVKRLGSVSPLQRGHDLTVAQRQEGNIPVFSSSGFAGYHNVAKAKGPGVITGRYGTIGKIYYSEQDFWAMNTSLYVYDFKGNYQKYIYYLLQILPFDAFTGKSAVPGVDRNDLHPLLVCQPPVSEQREIADYLNKQLGKFDNLATKIETAIERLQEYRAALISSVVTGKVQVSEL